MLVRNVEGRHVPRVQGLQLFPSEVDVTDGTDGDVADAACAALNYLDDRKDLLHSHGESLFVAVVSYKEVENKVVGSQLMLVCALVLVCH